MNVAYETASQLHIGEDPTVVVRFVFAIKLDLVFLHNLENDQNLHIHIMLRRAVRVYLYFNVVTNCFLLLFWEMLKFPVLQSAFFGGSVDLNHLIREIRVLVNVAYLVTYFSTSFAQWSRAQLDYLRIKELNSEKTAESANSERDPILNLQHS